MRHIVLSIALLSLFTVIQSWKLVRTKSLKSTLATVLIGSSLCLPSLCIADNGGAAKQAFFQPFDSSETAGEAIYDEKKILGPTIDRVKANFISMDEKFCGYMNKNKRIDALAVLSNYMGTMKVDMRTIAKILSDGDIMVRSSTKGISGTNEAAFNYNSGQFTLKPIAQEVETIIDSINDLYFNVVPNDDKESSLEAMNKISTMFNSWVITSKNYL